MGFVMTLCTGALYLRRYVSVHQSQRIVEQKIVLVMSILILFFNDPIYFISVFWPSTFRYHFYYLAQLFLFSFWLSLLSFCFSSGSLERRESIRSRDNSFRELQREQKKSFISYIFCAILLCFLGIIAR